MEEKETQRSQPAHNPLDPKDYTLATLINAIDRLKEETVTIRSLLVGERWQQHPEGYFPELLLTGGWFKQAGFTKGQRVILSIQPGLILIRSERAAETRG